MHFHQDFSAITWFTARYAPEIDDFVIVDCCEFFFFFFVAVYGCRVVPGEEKTERFG